jgi:hypothetical protein
MDVIPTSVVSTSGQFRDSRRGNIRVLTDTLDLCELVVTIPADREGLAPVTHRIVFAGEGLKAMHRELGRLIDTPRNRRRFEVKSALRVVS